MQVIPQAMLPAPAMMPAGVFANGRSFTQQELLLMQQQALLQQQAMLQQAVLARNNVTEMSGMAFPIAQMTPVTTQMATVTPLAAMTPMGHVTLASPFAQLPCGQSAASASEPGTDSSDEGKDMSEASAELMAQLEAGGAARAGALEALRGAVVDLAFDPSGCRIVQKALQVGGSSAASLAKEMQGHVRRASRSPHANHVIQRIAEFMPLSCVVMVAEELAGMAVTIAKNQFGSRVLHRLCKRIDQERRQNPSTTLPEVDLLLEEALTATARLCRHEWGRFVILSFLECGTSAQHKCIFEALKADALGHAVHRHSSDIVVQLFALLSEDDRDTLAAAVLLSGDGGFAAALKTLTLTQHGYRAARAACAIPGPHRDQILQGLPVIAEALAASKQGRRFLRDLEEMEGGTSVFVCDIEVADDEQSLPAPTSGAPIRWADL